MILSRRDVRVCHCDTDSSLEKTSKVAMRCWLDYCSLMCLAVFVFVYKKLSPIRDPTASLSALRTPGWPFRIWFASCERLVFRICVDD